MNMGLLHVLEAPISPCISIWHVCLSISQPLYLSISLCIPLPLYLPIPLLISLSVYSGSRDAAAALVEGEDARVRDEEMGALGVDWRHGRDVAVRIVRLPGGGGPGDRGGRVRRARASRRCRGGRGGRDGRGRRRGGRGGRRGGRGGRVGRDSHRFSSCDAGSRHDGEVARVVHAFEGTTTTTTTTTTATTTTTTTTTTHHNTTANQTYY